jgi:hypothetical protein
MNKQELKAAVESKTIEFETAMAEGKSNGELMEIYKELKELKYQLVKAENVTAQETDMDVV